MSVESIYCKVCNCNYGAETDPLVGYPRCPECGSTAWTYIFSIPAATSGKASDTQVGGYHYKDFAIQPAIFCQRNKLGCMESAIVKYACRHQDKNGAEDIKKIIHYAQWLLEEEYGETG